MMNIKPIAVKIVEDDPQIRAYLESIVAEDVRMELKGSYSDAEAFLDWMPRGGCDVVLMDINLSGKLTGIDAVRTCKPSFPETQFLMCTVLEDPKMLFDALKAGATGYLLKSAGRELIADSIISINAGGAPMLPQIARMVVQSFAAPPVQPDVAKLTDREREVLDLLAKGFRYKEIAAKFDVSFETVRTHVRNIYDKLHVQSRTEAINKAYLR